MNEISCIKLRKKKINFGDVDGIKDTSKITGTELGKCDTSEGHRRQQEADWKR